MSVETIGILSALLVLSGFVGNEFGFVKSNTFWYDSINLVASAGLFYFAYQTHSIPFLMTNSVWGAVSLFDLLNLTPRRARRRI